MWMTYVTRSDTDGRMMLVEADQPILDTDTHDGRGVRYGMADSLRIKGGGELEVLARGVYRAVRTGEILRADDPNAP
jgi:hypothetical protein